MKYYNVQNYIRYKNDVEKAIKNNIGSNDVRLNMDKV